MGGGNAAIGKRGSVICNRIEFHGGIAAHKITAVKFTETAVRLNACAAIIYFKCRYKMPVYAFNMQRGDVIPAPAVKRGGVRFFRNAAFQPPFRTDAYVFKPPYIVVAAPHHAAVQYGRLYISHRFKIMRRKFKIKCVIGVYYIEVLQRNALPAHHGKRVRIGFYRSAAQRLFGIPDRKAFDRAESAHSEKRRIVALGHGFRVKH